MAHPSLQVGVVAWEVLHRVFSTRARSSSRSHQLKLPQQPNAWHELVLAAVFRKYPHANASEAQLAAVALESSLAPNTQTVYSSRFKQFIVYCEQHEPQLTPLPASAETVDLFLLSMAAQGTVSGEVLAQLSSTINTVHTLLGYEPPVSPQSSSRLLRAGLTRTLQPIEHLVNRLPLLADTMYALVQLGKRTFEAEVVRDVVAVCMLFLFLLRVSSVAALGFEDLKITTVQGQVLITVTARTVKNQHTPVHWLFYSSSCPDVAVVFRRWLRLRQSLFGPCQPVSLWQLNPPGPSSFSQADLESMLHKCLQRIGFSDSQLVGYLTHSGRIGGASAMNAAGIDKEVIRTWGKWTTSGMVDQYVRSVPPSPRNAYFFGWMHALPPAFR